MKVPKLNKGQFFDDLDFPTKLLARQGDLVAADEISTKTVKKGPLIQEIGGTSTSTGLKDSIEEIRAAGKEFNWEIEQNVVNNDNAGLLGNKYGFNNGYDSIIGVSLSNGNDINELDNPESTTAEDRVLERLKKEDLQFDEGYYLHEYMVLRTNDEEELEISRIKVLLDYTVPLVKTYLKWYKNTPDEAKIASGGVMPIEFTEKEQEQMHDHLPKKEYLVDNNEIKALYITILNVLFGYVFEQIENEGIHSTESAWTIGKLVPQIAFLDQQLISEKDDNKHISIIKASLLSGIKNSLSWTLHRNFDLSIKAWKQVYYLLTGGKKLVVRALLDVHEVFRFHDVYYVYDKILLSDLCSWFINQGSEVIVKSLAVDMKRELDNITKEDVTFVSIVEGTEEGQMTTWYTETLAGLESLAEADVEAATAQAQAQDTANNSNI